LAVYNGQNMKIEVLIILHHVTLLWVNVYDSLWEVHGRRLSHNKSFKTKFPIWTILKTLYEMWQEGKDITTLNLELTVQHKLRTFACKIFQHWFFSETFTTVRWRVSYVRNVQKWGTPTSVSGEKNRVHRTSKIIKSRQSYSNGHLPYHWSFYYLVHVLMHDVVCEFVCAVKMRRNNWLESPDVKFSLHYFLIKTIF